MESALAVQEATNKSLKIDQNLQVELRAEFESLASALSQTEGDNSEISLWIEESKQQLAKLDAWV